MLEAALENCKKYGFKPIEFDGFSHPRLVFLCDDDYDYAAETFAMFNAQQISKLFREQAISLACSHAIHLISGVDFVMLNLQSALSEKLIAVTFYCLTLKNSNNYD